MTVSYLNSHETLCDDDYANRNILNQLIYTTPMLVIRRKPLCAFYQVSFDTEVDIDKKNIYIIGAGPWTG